MSGPRPPGQPGITPLKTGLQPQKRLFIVLAIVMVVWIGALLTMYFTTVWGHSSKSGPRENDVDDHHPTTLNG